MRPQRGATAGDEKGGPAASVFQAPRRCAARLPLSHVHAHLLIVRGAHPSQWTVRFLAGEKVQACLSESACPSLLVRVCCPGRRAAEYMEDAGFGTSPPPPPLPPSVPPSVPPSPLSLPPSPTHPPSLTHSLPTLSPLTPPPSLRPPHLLPVPPSLSLPHLRDHLSSASPPP